MPEFDCPTCNRSFDTRRGLGVHHSHIHDERLPNRECAACGDEFYSDYAKKYCSDECHRESVSFEGELNPNDRGAKEKTDCRICGSEFEYYPSDKPGLYCSKCVETETWQTSPRVSGPDHPRWSGGVQERECTVCGTTVSRDPRNISSEVVLCSDDCQRKWLSEAFSGPGHPNWKGGGNESYGKGWAPVRQQALDRDGYQCVICGTTKEDLGRNPDVHHIVPVRTFIDSDEHTREDAHTLDNVVSLCIGCHRRADFGRIAPETLRERAGIDTAGDG